MASALCAQNAENKMINHKYRKNAARNERILKLYDAHPHTAKFGFAWHEYHKGSIRWIAREMGLSVSCVSGVVYRRNKKLAQGKSAVNIKEPWRPRTSY